MRSKLRNSWEARKPLESLQSIASLGNVGDLEPSDVSIHPKHLNDSKHPEGPEDPVSHPRHYTSSPACCSGCGKPIECIDVARQLSFNLGNVVKYLWREQQKDGTQDLEKALWYLGDEIETRLARLDVFLDSAETTQAGVDLA